MKKLTESDIIQIIREEWKAKIKALSEEVSIKVLGKVDGKETVLLSPETKIKHKGTDDLYTFVRFIPRSGELDLDYLQEPTADTVKNCDVCLRNPQGKEFIIDQDTLEKEYVV
jgi:hypothetical protein